MFERKKCEPYSIHLTVTVRSTDYCDKMTDDEWQNRLPTQCLWRSLGLAELAKLLRFREAQPTLTLFSHIWKEVSSFLLQSLFYIFVFNSLKPLWWGSASSKDIIQYEEMSLCVSREVQMVQKLWSKLCLSLNVATGDWWVNLPQ